MAMLGVPATDIGYSVVQCLRKRITFADAAKAITVGVLPPGSIVLPGSGVQVLTAFNDSGTDLLDIGTSGNADAYASAIVLSTVGFIVVDELATYIDYSDTAEVTVTATYTAQNSNATAGVGVVVIPFIAKTAY